MKGDKYKDCLIKSIYFIAVWYKYNELKTNITLDIWCTEAIWIWMSDNNVKMPNKIWKNKTINKTINGKYKFLSFFLKIKKPKNKE